MPELRLIYDGDCPFCSRYVQLVNIRKAVGEIELIDARRNHDAAQEVAKRNLDLDQGMVLVMDGRYFHGADALNRLALMGTSSGWFNWLNSRLFARPALARVIYPILRAGRNLTLFALRRSKLN
jgi:predicted DCC family thiol-disulfide oxidoreductase YuxK